MTDLPPQNPTPPIISVTKDDYSPTPPAKHTGKRALKVTLLLLLVAILGLGGFVVIKATGLASKVFVGEESSFYNNLTAMVLGDHGEATLIGEKEDRVNVLLLGIGGPGHDGPYLSDTMIIASIKPSDKTISLSSLPRDYLAELDGGERKLNNAFADGFAKNKNYNDAGKAAIATIEKISGLKIPYFAVIDFKGFQQAIDILGGVDVTVDRTFTDYTYPDEKDGYLPAVTFTAGPQHLNGARALIFARSRHAAGPEGSDFARSVRQQKVISATKNKALQLNLITDSGKINQLLKVLGDRFHTNINLGEMIRLYNLGKDADTDNIITRSLDPSTGLICPQILESNGAYVLVPCPGKTKDDIKNFFLDSFNANSAKVATIWLADSTAGAKNYRSAQALLEKRGFTVYQLPYTGSELEYSLMYQINKRASDATLINKDLGTKEVSLPPPGVKADSKKADIIVVLGKNYVAPKVNGATTAPKEQP